MAITETQQQPPTPPPPSLSTQILNPQSAPTPTFTFDAQLKKQHPTLGLPSKIDRPLCQDYLSAPDGCPRGPLCPNRHYVPKEDRSGVGHLICKHYQRGLCKKADACDFAHIFNLRDERECKEFSKFGLCPQGEDCTYLHIPPTSELRRPACQHYTRGFCPLGPYCGLRHIKHPVPCPYYMAGFCPNGRSHPPDADKVIVCQYGAHVKWIKDEDIRPPKPEPRKPRDLEQERRDQEERQEEFDAEEERRKERFDRGEPGGRWTARVGGGRRGRGRGFGRRF